MTPEEKEDRYRIPLGELAPVISAAAFGVVFFVTFLWVALGSPFADVVSRETKAQAQTPAAAPAPTRPGEVNVALPDKH